MVCLYYLRSSGSLIQHTNDIIKICRWFHVRTCQSVGRGRCASVRGSTPDTTRQHATPRGHAGRRVRHFRMLVIYHRTEMVEACQQGPIGIKQLGGNARGHPKTKLRIDLSIYRDPQSKYKLLQVQAIVNNCFIWQGLRMLPVWLVFIKWTEFTWLFPSCVYSWHWIFILHYMGTGNLIFYLLFFFFRCRLQWEVGYHQVIFT